MVRNYKTASLGVLSLLAAIMTALAFTVNRPIADDNKSADTGVFADYDNVSQHVLIDDIFYHNADDKEDFGQTKYLLKEHSGYIGIFTEAQPNSPQSVTEILISKLREADAVMLIEGIVVSGEEELAKILEDFGS